MTAPEEIPLGLTPLITLATSLKRVTLRLDLLAAMDVLTLRMQFADHYIHSHNRYQTLANEFLPRFLEPPTTSKSYSESGHDNVITLCHLMHNACSTARIFESQSLWQVFCPHFDDGIVKHSPQSCVRPLIAIFGAKLRVARFRKMGLVLCTISFMHAWRGLV